jgi:type IV pilus assembly protein PilO
VADLPRIVTQHDIKIRAQDKAKDQLVMETTAKTYRYIDEEEVTAKSTGAK